MELPSNCLVRHPGVSGSGGFWRSSPANWTCGKLGRLGDRHLESGTAAHDARRSPARVLSSRTPPDRAAHHRHRAGGRRMGLTERIGAKARSVDMSSSALKRVLRVANGLHVALYRMSGGRLANRIANMPILLMLVTELSVSTRPSSTAKNAPDSMKNSKQPAAIS